MLITPLILVGTSLLTFGALDVLPGSAAQALLGMDASPELVAELEAELRLDRPAATRYLEWFSGAVRGDFGRALASGQPARALIVESLPVTLELIALALSLAMSMALASALLAVRKPNGIADRLTATLSMVFLSVPSYVLAPLLVLLFAIKAQLVPSIGYTPLAESISGNIRSLLLPAIALGFPFFGLYTRFLRGDLLEQIGKRGYIVTAVAKGLGPWTVLIRHALRNSLFGLVTVVGLNVGALIGGAVIIERIFGLPGLGHLLLNAINTRDVPIVQAIVLITAATTVIANLCVDLVNIALDPRIRDA